MGAKLGQNNVKGEQTKHAILVAAEQVFAEAGYRGSSLASVAERAGVTQSGLLHHFKTKEELLLGVLEQHEVVDDALLLNPLSRGGASVLDGLADLLVQYSGNRVGARLFSVLVAESTAVEHPGHEYMRRRYDKLRNRLVGALAVGIESGEIRPDAPLEELAGALIALMDGIQLQWIYDRDIDMSAAFRFVATVLRDSLAPASTPA
ncbi:TetR/AcrR family transcriptional regulator [Homoserinibacter sp. GY 40078]|uniref:TetR/AcrR family transcriptional regulator n=1 Tax=Homoserinibacter sp. GY 40078 TaxID=2603275 RepID=UPI001650A87D|nr:TetR/AcrR family transcriptional regulator [Homoserinibacter sp. GY 40078]